MVADYLGEIDPRDAAASPLYGDLRGLPPVRVHVGNERIVLQDRSHEHTTVERIA